MNDMDPIKYVIISPVRDEEKYIRHTIQSVVSQTITPSEWVIVNDGSTDNTGKIVDEFAKKYSWIRPVHRQNRGFRKSGGGVMEAFYDGYEKLKGRDFDYIVKLDGDLSFDKDYFEQCFAHFAADHKLGIGGGDLYNIIDGQLILEKNPSFHVRGATKVYRRDCWDAIGELIKAPGWDTLDEVKANMLGWTTRSFSDIKVTHFRYTGSADGTWGGFVKNGRANYIAGYHPLFMAIKCIKRLFQRPYLVGSGGLCWGFLSGYLYGIEQNNDKALVRYLRKQQLNRLLFRRSIWQ